MLTTAFPRWQGDDRGIFIYNAAQAIYQQGIQVRVLGIHSPGAKTYEMMGDIEVIRTRYLPERWEVLQSEGGGLPEVWKRRPFARLALIPFVVAQIVAVAKYAQGCDLIHSNWTLSGFIAWLSRPIHSLPYLIMVHGSDVYKAGKIKAALLLMKPSIRSAEKIVAISRSLAEEVTRLQIRNDNPIIIPETIDTYKYLPPSDSAKEPYILFVGSLIPRKGVDILLNAFGKINTIFPEYKLIIIGEGSEKQSLLDLANTLRITDQVSFLGQCSPQVVSEWMMRSKLFVLPSREEGLGVVLLEACASGTPCIASNTGGIPDVIDSQIGVLFEAGDSEGLSAGIQSLLTDEEKWNAMSVGARKKIANRYSLQVVGEAFSALYTSIIGEHPHT